MDWDLCANVLVLIAFAGIGLVLRCSRRRPPGPGEQDLDQALSRFIERERRDPPPTTPLAGRTGGCTQRRSPSRRYR